MDTAPSSSPHPQLKVISDTYYSEYRFYANKAILTDRNDRTESANDWCFVWLDALIVALISLWLYQNQGCSRWHIFITIGISFLYAYWRCSRIIYESLIVIAPHGVQLETHRGPLNPLFVSRRFIPAIYIHDIILNEGLRRWNVRYYLAIMVKAPGENVELAVAFPNTLPRFPVLLEVYHGVTRALFNDDR